MADFGIDTEANRKIYHEMQVDETVRSMSYSGFLASQYVQDVARRRREFNSRRIQLKFVDIN